MVAQCVCVVFLLWASFGEGLSCESTFVPKYWNCLLVSCYCRSRGAGDSRCVGKSDGLGGSG